MTKALIVANWKMAPSSFREAEDLFFAVKGGMGKNRKTDVVFCPPFVWLTDLARRHKKSTLFGAQDAFWEQSGAFTGEISPQMLKSSGVKFVIIGHSERRRFLGESDEMINKKVRAALKAGLAPIIAIGEESQDAEDVVPPVLREQLSRALHGINAGELGKITVAYEPVWAIGTGRADTPDNATRRAIYIRKLLTKIAGAKRADGIRILYGGSVTSRNAASFLSQDIRGMDGLLVGGASLNAGEFVKIVDAVSTLRRV